MVDEHAAPSTWTTCLRAFIYLPSVDSSLLCLAGSSYSSGGCVLTIYYILNAIYYILVILNALLYIGYIDTSISALAKRA